MLGARAAPFRWGRRVFSNTTLKCDAWWLGNPSRYGRPHAG